MTAQKDPIAEEATKHFLEMTTFARCCYSSTGLAYTTYEDIDPQVLNALKALIDDWRVGLDDSGLTPAAYDGLLGREDPY
jgi:hypothetical protein